MSVNFTLYIDESGDSGVKKIRSKNAAGATPYMTLGATLVPNRYIPDIENKIKNISKDVGRNSLHCSQLNHRQKVYYCRSLQNEKILCFGVISLKSKLAEYKNEIDSNNRLFFNKCSQYLLERVGSFMRDQRYKPDQLSVIFEDGDIDLTRLRNLIKKCQETPINSQVALLNYVDPFKIRERTKEQQPLLQLADLTAHALYSCVNKSKHNFYIPESRYVEELRTKFYCDENTGAILGRGIKPIHNLSELKLDKDIHDKLNNLNAK